MPDQATYVLKGHGALETGWIRGCFRLFKERGVNIRRLVLVRNAPPLLDALEIQFVVGGPDRETFLQNLEGHLSAQSWQEKSLNRL